MWPAYEDWKRELVRRVDAARGTMDVELWDFTGFSPYADERVPRPGDTRTELQWYWEAGHFKKSLGDQMLVNMFGGQTKAMSALGSPADRDATSKSNLRQQRACATSTTTTRQS